MTTDYLFVAGLGAVATLTVQFVFGMFRRWLARDDHEFTGENV